MSIDIKSLHPLEIKVLKMADEGTLLSVSLLCDKLGYVTGHANQALSWLLAKGLITETKKEKSIYYELTTRGREAMKIGLAGERIIELIKEHKSLILKHIASKLNIDSDDVGGTFASLKKEGILGMDSEKKVFLLDSSKKSPSLLVYRQILNKAAETGILSEEELTLQEKEAIGRISRKRGSDSLLKEIERNVSYYLLTPQGIEAKAELEKAHITGDELGENTKEIITSGKWKEIPFREYALNAPMSRLFPGRLNPYSEFITTIKDKLVSMGFEEFDGPLVENEFWNGDALFMPQFHSARDIHDVYYVKDPAYTDDIDKKWLDNVKAVHENGGDIKSRGWEYKFDPNFSHRQLLRSQGTVLSAHRLTQAKVPSKYFGVVRCFRYDQVDATHGADFYQTEGIVISKNANLRTLLGMLKMFATEIAGASEVKYVPGYFPFTEPSVEVHIKHPVLGWFELGGSGIFRPEVTKPLGIDVPVLAWGMGIDRMALMHLGLNDLRDLFDNDLEKVRMRRNTNA